MRTAEEYIEEQGCDPEILDYGKMIDAINVARKECLEEAAESIKILYDKKVFYISESIELVLNLIKELK